MNTQIQHGDILFHRVKAVPKGAKQVKRKDNRLVVAEGELTGHHHTITDSGASLFELNGQLYLDVTAEEVTVTHEEHKPLAIPAGVYEVGRVREYDYFAEMQRPVAD